MHKKCGPVATVTAHEAEMRTTAKNLTFAAVPAIAAALLFGSVPADAKPRHHAVSHTGAKHSVKSHRGKTGKKPRPVQDARKLFGAVKLPSATPIASIGRIDNGCIAGAATMPITGPHWQVMRLSRNRYYGHPELIDYLKKLGDRAAQGGWGNGILIGDMGMPRGGPMPTGHASHQAGRDTDLWVEPAPQAPLTNEERETKSAQSVLKLDSAELDPNVWTQQKADFVHAAAEDPRVARIFVTPAIKKYLCDRKNPNGSDTDWLRRLRPWYGHDNHIHVRLSCVKGDKACVDQDAPPPGDGCGKEVTDWMKTIAKDPPNSSVVSPPTPIKPKPAFPLSSMPAQCRAVLNAKP